MRVLVIEDETGLQADIRQRLETEGYIVDTSGEGNEGLFFATEYPLDVAIIDIGLPGISVSKSFSACVNTAAPCRC